jgi:uncharacterized protein
MTIWLTGDLHFNLKQFQYLLKQQQNYDILCLSGDLLDSSKQELNWQKQEIATLLAKFSKPVFICSGNHDVDGAAEHNHYLDIDKKDNLYLDGRIKTIEHIRFGVMGYGCADMEPFARCDILLTHVPPAHTKVAQDRKGDWGDAALYAKLKSGVLEPKFVFCGHVEQPLAQRVIVNKTVVVNAGANHEDSVPRVGVIQC